MKKIISLIFVFLFIFVANVQAEEISSFDQILKINSDGSFDVTEKILYDFGNIQKHGIYRDIPYKYDNGVSNYTIKINKISVVDEKGQLYNFSVSNSSGNKNIKIGDKNVLISGKHTYKISYSVKGAINFFEDFDEVYWNVTGNNWPVKINNISSTVIFPDNVSKDSVKTSCYAGVFGTKRKCDSVEYISRGTNKSSSILSKNKILKSEEGLTIAVGFPKGVVDEPTKFVLFLKFLLDNFIFALPVVTFIFLYYLWRKKGKDEIGNTTIVTQFDAPKNLSPMAVGTLIDERADDKDFSGNIISLAVKGYLKIVKLEGEKMFQKDDYVFIRLKGSSELTENEDSSLEKLFSHVKESDAEKIENLKKIVHIEDVKNVLFLSNLKNIFYKDLDSLKKDIYRELFESGYFVGNPDKIRKKYYLIGYIPLFLLIYSIGFFDASYAISIALSLIILIIFSRFMPKRTKQGTLAREHILGLKKYLEVAEKDRLDFHNAPEKNPETFEKLLPFAIALGVEKKWTKQFSDIFENYQPTWFVGSGFTSFSNNNFSGFLSDFTSKTNRMAASKPSSSGSSGGGFSGGGFGGGGGGSW